VPELADEPDLEDHLGLYVMAFQTLSMSRPITMSGEGPIPLSEMIIGQQVFLPDAGTDEILRWVRYLQAMDAAYLEIRHASQRKRKR
jgi:hypothetical protein